MALERLGKRAAQLAANEAEAAFVTQQTETLEAMNQETFQTAVDDLHTTNMASLAELVELEKHLAIPQLADEISQLIPQETWGSRSLSWVPYAPATVSESLAARDGLMAIRAWVIAPDTRPHNLSLFIGLYHERCEGAHGVPKLAVTGLFQNDPERPETPTVNLESLLQQDSIAGHTYLKLLKQQERRPSTAIDNPAQKDTLETYCQAVMNWSKQLTGMPEPSEVKDMLKVESTLWELGNPEWRGPANPPMTLARHVKAADSLLEIVAHHGLPPACIPISTLEQSPGVHQSGQSLGSIEQLFQPAAAREQITSRWRKKTTIEAAGMVARQAVVVIDINEARFNLHNMVDMFYDQVLT